MEYSKPAQVTLNGVPVLKISETDVSAKSNDQPVLNLEGGLDGFSDGAAEMTADLTQGIPLSGFVVDWISLALTHTTIRPAFKLAGRTFECEGRVMTAGWSSKVNVPNSTKLSFHGRVVAVVVD